MKRVIFYIFKNCLQLKTLIDKKNENGAADLLDVENLSLDDNNTNGNDVTEKAKTDPMLSLDKLAMDYNSIEMNWKSSRKNCTCSKETSSFDCASAKLNCSRCGEIYCERCVENGKYMTSQVSTKLIFVCHNCIDRFQLWDCWACYCFFFICQIYFG